MGPDYSSLTQRPMNNTIDSINPMGQLPLGGIPLKSVKNNIQRGASLFTNKK